VRWGQPIGCDNRGTMPEPRRAVLDVVELLADSGRWPAGTVGTVVEADDAQALVEVSDDRGHALDFIAVPHCALGSRPSRSEDRVAR
jgi:hypothetical protein